VTVVLEQTSVVFDVHWLNAVSIRIGRDGVSWGGPQASLIQNCLCARARRSYELSIQHLLAGGSRPQEGTIFHA
jgi:hypothetical protein